MPGKRAALRAAALGLLALGAVAPARAQSAPGAQATGLWTRATTVATLRGRWLDAQRFQRLCDTESPDEVLRCFPQQTALTLTAVALETGFDVFLRARATPGQALPIPGKDLEVVFHAQRARTLEGRVAHRPVYTLRLAKRAAPVPFLPGRPFVPPPGPLPPPGPPLPVPGL